MSSEKEILDNPEKEVIAIENFKSRVPRDLMIVIGVLFTILGLYMLYLFCDQLYIVNHNRQILNLSITEMFWTRVIIRSSPPLLYGICLSIGGIGLILRSKVGWVCSVAIAVFAISLPLLSALSAAIHFNLTSRFPIWLALLLISIFGLLLAFLLSTSVRNYFSPSLRLYSIAGAIVLVLALDFLVIPLSF